MCGYVSQKLFFDFFEGLEELFSGLVPYLLVGLDLGSDGFSSCGEVVSEEVVDIAESVGVKGNEVGGNVLGDEVDHTAGVGVTGELNLESGFVVCGRYKLVGF